MKVSSVIKSLLRGLTISCLALPAGATLLPVDQSSAELESLSRPSRLSRTFNVEIPVNQTLRGSDRVDLSRRIDLNRYLGYQLVGAEIAGDPAHSQARVNLHIAGRGRGSVLLRNRNHIGVLTLSSPIVIRGNETLELFNRGDVLVYSVTLKFIRR